MSEPVQWKVGDSRTLTHTFSRHELDAFARLTGDINPLHMDAGYASRFAEPDRDPPYVKDMPVRAKQVEVVSNPMRRLCTADDVANAVQFIASPQAAHINGVNLPVTGGARMP